MKPLWLWRVLIQAHAWIGLAAAAALAVIALSGSALVLKDPWIRWSVPAARATVPLDSAALARVALLADEALGREQLVAMKFATPDLGVHRAYLADGGGAFLDGAGRVVARWPRNGRLEDWLLDLHFKLLGGTAGETAAGWLGLAATALAVSGLLLWWPARGSYRHRFLPRSLERRELLGTHRNLGVWSVLPIAALSLSGTMMIFHEPSLAVLSRLLGDSASAAEPTGAVSVGATSAIDWTEIFAQGERRFPTAAARIANWPVRGGPVVVRYRQPGELHPNGRSTVTLDPASGYLLASQDALAFPRALKVQHALYPLHSARIGGPWYAALIAVGGFMLAALGVLGGVSFLRRWRRRMSAAIPATPPTLVPEPGRANTDPLTKTVRHP